jgi:hypothetical protein
MNQLDLRVLLSKVLTGVLLLPWLVSYYGGKMLSALAARIEAGNGAVRKWANPDLHGKAPKRARKLLYRRRTVERLAARIEEQQAMIDRLYGRNDAP